MRRVLLLCPGSLEHGGGIGRQMDYFLAALPQAAETPAYTVIDTRGPWFLGSARWRVPLSAAYLMAAGLRIAWVGVASRPSLMHANITGRGSTLRKLVLTTVARMVALPYVLHVHDYDYAADVRARGGVMRHLVRGMFAAAEHTIVLGTEAERSLRVALALPDARILVLPNAVPDPNPAPRAGVGCSAGSLVHLVFLGYLSARKGVPELLEALASPALAALSWRATLAGGGPVDEFCAKATALGLAEHVNFPVGSISRRQAPCARQRTFWCYRRTRKGWRFGSRGAGARACGCGDAGRRTCRGDRTGPVRPVGATGRRGCARRCSHPGGLR